MAYPGNQAPWGYRRTPMGWPDHRTGRIRPIRAFRLHAAGLSFDGWHREQPARYRADRWRVRCIRSAVRRGSARPAGRDRHGPDHALTLTHRLCGSELRQGSPCRPVCPVPSATTSSSATARCRSRPAPRGFPARRGRPGRSCPGAARGSAGAAPCRCASWATGARRAPSPA